MSEPVYEAKHGVYCQVGNCHNLATYLWGDYRRCGMHLSDITWTCAHCGNHQGPHQNGCLYCSKPKSIG